MNTEPQSTQQVSDTVVPVVGRGYRIRRLIDGRFVGEVRRGIWPFRWWEGVDIGDPEYTWGTKHYHYCVGTLEQVVKALACQGAASANPTDGRQPTKGTNHD